MVKVASCFAQVLNLIDRHGFGAAVRNLDAERGAKGFRCWDQFVGMLFCQLGSAHSLREICGGLATALGKMVHLGLKAAPKRSTLAYANEHRPWELYQRVFEQMLGHCQDLAAGRKRTFRFQNPLRILDATVIDLCLEMFDWARFRRTKGAIKLHLQLQERGCLPCWALVTEGRTHEVRVAQGLTFDPGTIVAMDRAYTDYALFGRWTAQSVFFVTRMKSNAQYEVIHTIPGGENGVQREEWIQLTGTAAAPRRLPPRRAKPPASSIRTKSIAFSASTTITSASAESQAAADSPAIPPPMISTSVCMDSRYRWCRSHAQAGGPR